MIVLGDGESSGVYSVSDDFDSAIAQSFLWLILIAQMCCVKVDCLWKGVL